MLWLQLFLPFAAGFFLSYVYRTANSVIAPLIGVELGLGDGALGLLTSSYFLAFGVAQLPVGVLLDRYGPRRVEPCFLVVAAIGALIYATAQELSTLTFGRAVIGLGVSACLMGPLKAFAIAYPKERLASLTSWIMVSGGLGAILAASPLEYFLEFLTWREVCVVGAVLTLFVALLIFTLAPDLDSRDSRPLILDTGVRQQLADAMLVFRSPQFLRFAPVSFFFTGGFQALQGLWAARWMGVYGSGDKMDVATQLTGMNIAVLVGMVLLALFATPMVRRGIRLEMIYSVAMLIACLLLGVMLFQPALGGFLFWPLLGLCFSQNSLAYTLLSQTFPANYAGRTNSALNMVILGGAFGLQWGLGWVIDLFRFYEVGLQTAYQWGFGILVGGQLLAWIWFGWVWRQPLTNANAN